jgi:hypothetical protein
MVLLNDQCIVGCRCRYDIEALVVRFGYLTIQWRTWDRNDGSVYVVDHHACSLGVGFHATRSMTVLVESDKNSTIVFEVKSVCCGPRFINLVAVGYEVLFGVRAVDKMTV